MPVLDRIRTLARCLDAGPQDDVQPIEDAAVAWDAGRFVWAGRRADLPAAYEDWPRVDGRDGLVVPGLVDAHTHLAFGGWRADEFERRLRGESYLDIARAGGGIARTVAATRAASADTLEALARDRLREMAALGVTTVECKSGYGLDRETELTILDVYQRLARTQPLRIAATFLGAHVVPPEYRDRREAYVALLTDDLIPLIASRRLARFCDVFVEETAFSVDEARTIFAAARRHGLRAKLHADQLSDGGGAALAADVGAASADHLEHISADGIARLRDAGVVAVSLPIATLYLHAPPLPARALIEAGVPVAVATDFNPGSAPSAHLPLALTLACTLQRMTPNEALKGATLHAARAIGFDREIGSIEPGKRADFALIDAPTVAHWLYHFRANACTATYVDGVRVSLAA